MRDGGIDAEPAACGLFAAVVAVWLPSGVMLRVCCDGVLSLLLPLVGVDVDVEVGVVPVAAFGCVCMLVMESGELDDGRADGVAQPD